jgi:multiple sugar transport system ATP-binding protein
VSDLRLEGVTKRFGAVAALNSVSLSVADGELMVVLGATGAGKTTLVRAIAGLERPDAGTVSIGGADVTAAAPADRDVAVVFQNFSLYPRLTVRENLEFPLRAPRRSQSRAERDRRVTDAARLLRIERLLDRKASQLSGGEMQRVAIGRAIVREPRAFLMDEPLSNLDAKLREEMRVEIRALRSRLGTTTLYVTHDQVEAMSLADRLAVLHEGRVEQVGTPSDVYANPASVAVARSLGYPVLNLLDGRVEGGRLRAGPLDWPAPAGIPSLVTIGIRPESVRLESGGVPGRVTVVEDLGPEKVVTVDLGAGVRVRALVAGTHPVCEGDGAAVRIAGEALRLFERESERRIVVRVG